MRSELRRLAGPAGLVLLAAVAACAPALRGPEPVVEPLPYRAAIEAAHRRTVLYRDFITAVDVDAVFLSWDVRFAHLMAMAEARLLPPDQVQALWDAELERGSRFVEFYLGVYASDRAWSDLAAPEPAWSVFLTGTPGELRPLRIEVWEPEPQERWLFFPDLSPWSRLYKVTFPAVDPESGQEMVTGAPAGFGLEFRSVFGVTDCRWEFAGGE